jgi:two-component system cell cycle sensor histidine kinase/response regulator CckA
LDVSLLTRHLTRAGYEVTSERVETPEAMHAALETEEWDVVLCDYSMPHFNALSALSLLKETGLDIPFIIISGTVGEDVAVKAMLSGASDYLMKDNLTRLVPTIEREIQEAESRYARRRAEEALRESEDRYRDLVEHSHDLICTHDLTGRILSVNKAAITLLGYDQATLLNKNIRDILFHEYQHQFDDYIRELQTNGIAHGVMAVQTRTGEKRIWEYTNTLRTEDVAAPVVRGVAHDVTEQKRAEAELRRSEAQYRRIIDTTFEGVWIFDAELRTAYVNQRLTEMLGIKAEEIIGRSSLDFVAEDSRADVQQRLQQRTRGIKEQYDVHLRRKDGSDLWVIACATPILDEHGAFTGSLSMLTDITERKQVEEELRFRKSLLESQTEASIDGILVVSTDRTILSYNKRFLELWNIPEEILRVQGDKAALDYVFDQLTDPQEFLERVEYLYEHPEEQSHDEILLKDGRTVDRYSAPVKSDENEYYGRVWFFRDITERKRAEEALRESEGRYRLLFEGNPLPMWVFDVETLAFLAVNDAAVHHYGYSRDEFLSMTIKDIRPREDIPALLEHVSEANGTLDKAGVWRHRRKDGQLIEVEIVSHELVFAGRRAELVLANDVTERKRIEEELRKSEERYRDLVENAHDIIYTHDLEGNYTSINKASERITGYTREESLRMNLAQTVAPEYLEKARQMLAKKIAGEELTAYELEIIAKDGHRAAVEVNTRIIIEEGVPVGVQGIARDVTERKQLEEQLRQAQKMEAIGQLAGGVAHDFNNLLTVITGYSDLATRKLQREDPLRRNIEEIKKAGDRAASLTRQLLAFSRKQVLQPKVLDLNAVISELEKMLRRLIGEDVELRTALESGLGSIKADPGQIEQVIMNLAVNARDAMPAGGKLLIETENVSLSEEYAGQHIAVTPGSYVMLAVSDTGTGMDEKTKARIFEPFFTTKELGKGTGLGLSTVYGIVKQSGGSLWVYSEVGRGTTFKVYLPRVDENAQEYRQATDTGEVLQGTETILLAEDEEIVRTLAREILESYGYQVLEAANGGAALLICERHTGAIDLLITDVIMPEMSGRELSERLSQLRPAMKVLYMSGYTDDAIIHQGVLDTGANFIQKPFSPDALAQKVREVLDKSE